MPCSTPAQTSSALSTALTLKSCSFLNVPELLLSYPALRPIIIYKLMEKRGRRMGRRKAGTAPSPWPCKHPHIPLEPPSPPDAAVCSHLRQQVISLSSQTRLRLWWGCSPSHLALCLPLSLRAAPSQLPWGRVHFLPER